MLTKVNYKLVIILVNITLKQIGRGHTNTEVKRTHNINVPFKPGGQKIPELKRKQPHK